jgi:uncharacterized protein YggE
MRKIWLVVAGVALILVVGLSGCSPGSINVGQGAEGVQFSLSSQQRGIWVSGEGKVMAVPDVAILSLGIQAQETTVAEAQAQAADAMDRVMAALTDGGVAKKDIQTQNFNIQKVTRFDNVTQQEVLIGYQVTNTVTAKVRQIDKTGAIIDAVAQAGGDLTRVNSVGFTVDDPTSYYVETRQKAVADASAKAKQLADLAGVKLGKPTYISESSYTPGPIYRQDLVPAAVPAPAVQTPISPGQQEITTDVQLAYDIID